MALGETGLIAIGITAPFDVQQDYFDRHLRLSQAARPAVYRPHSRERCRRAGHAARGRQRGPLRGVMHSFTGTAETAAECVELGLYISFAGMVTFKKSDDLRAVAATIPADRILIETDSPYLSPHPLRGKRNEPANLVHTAAAGRSAKEPSKSSLDKRQQTLKHFSVCLKPACARCIHPLVGQ